MTTVTTDNVERAWSGGPLRRVGTGHGTPSRYVCEACGECAHTGVRLKRGLWQCASCEAGHTRQPSSTPEKLAHRLSALAKANEARQSASRMQANAILVRRGVRGH